VNIFIICHRAHGFALLAIFSNTHAKRSMLRMSVGLTTAIHLQSYPKWALRLPKTEVPLQSIKNIGGFFDLLPDLKATLLSLTRSSEVSSRKLVFYWLNTPSMAFLLRPRPKLTFEVLTLHSMLAEANPLP